MVRLRWRPRRERRGSRHDCWNFVATCFRLTRVLLPPTFWALSFQADVVLPGSYEQTHAGSSSPLSMVFVRSLHPPDYYYLQKSCTEFNNYSRQLSAWVGGECFCFVAGGSSLGEGFWKGVGFGAFKCALRCRLPQAIGKCLLGLQVKSCHTRGSCSGQNFVQGADDMVSNGDDGGDKGSLSPGGKCAARDD